VQSAMVLESARLAWLAAVIAVVVPLTLAVFSGDLRFGEFATSCGWAMDFGLLSQELGECRSCPVTQHFKL
jgi:hypothetical protein